MDNKDKIIKNIAPVDLKIGTYHNPQDMLLDRRPLTNGIVFGTIENVAKQYGIKMKVNGDMYIYTAPKSRLQLFVEKLHFAKVPFFEL
jgi:hypothetical protein